MAKLNDIIAGLEELRCRGQTSSWIDPQSDWCVTFKFSDALTNDAPFWLQVLGAALNMQYLDEDEPASRLGSEIDGFPTEFRQIAWDKCQYATFEMPQAYSAQLPELLDRVARQYFGLEADYRVTYEVEDHGA